MAFLQPWQSTTANPRLFQVSSVTRTIGAWSDLHRAPTGDARGSSADALTDEFLGDYNCVFATNDYAVATWNDARDAADCPATFGNTDIFGGSYPDPTP